MTGRSKQVLWPTLKEVTSSDLNRMGLLAGKGTMDLARALTAPFSTSPRDVVVTGLDATIAGAGTLPVSISKGVLFRFDNLVTPITGDDSDYLTGTLALNTVVNRSISDAVFPRIDIIYATIADADSSSANRNQLTLPSRVIAPAALSNTRMGTVTLGNVEGVAAASPLFPTGLLPAGSVPLWAVYIPALSSAVLVDHLMDMRVYWTSWANAMNRSGVESGFMVERAAAGATTVTYRLGTGFVTGAAINNSADKNFAMSAIMSVGESFAANVDYDFYLVAKGNGVPVGKTVPDGVVPVASANNAPDTEGRPSVDVIIQPLAFAASNAITGLGVTTDRALHLGSLYTADTAAFPGDGAENIGSPLLDRAGKVYIQAMDLADGRFPGNRGWLHRGVFTWFSTTVAVLNEGACGVIDGTPFTCVGASVDGAKSFDLASSLASGVALTASTWYYCYLRKRFSNRGGQRTPARARLVPIISNSPPTTLGSITTPEAGFDAREYLYVGPIYVNASSEIQRFFKTGNIYRWASGFAALTPVDVAVNPAKTTVTTRAPSTVRESIVHIVTVADGGSIADTISVYIHATTGLSDTYLISPSAGAFGGVERFAVGEVGVPVNSSGQFQLSRGAILGTSTILVSVDQVGFREADYA